MGVRALLLAFGLLLGDGTPVEAAEAVAVRAAEHPTYGRLVLDWADPVGVERRSGEGGIVLRFDRPFVADLAAARTTLSSYVESLEGGADGRTLTIAFRPGFALKQLRQFQPDLVVVDVAEEDAAATPVSGADDGQVAVRIGKHADFTRLVFDFPGPVQHRASRMDRDLTVAFDRETAVDLGGIAGELAPLVEEIAPLPEARTGVRIRLAPGTGADVFGLSEDLVVIDFRGATVSGEAGPLVEPIGARDQAVLAAPETDASEELPDDAREVMAIRPAAGETKADEEPIVAGGPATDPPAGDPTQFPEVGTVVGPEGIELSVAWPDRSAAAAFRRGDHLWLVFDRPVSQGWRPPALDPAISEHVGPLQMIELDGELHQAGGTVLRLPAHPLLNVRVDSDGVVWRILLGPTAGEPARVGVERRSDPPRLQIVGQGAVEPISVTDPMVGDRLLVWPLSTPGVGSPSRSLVDVEFLASAQGVVLRPRSDAVVAEVAAGGLVVGADGGLRLSGARPADRTPDPRTADADRETVTADLPSPAVVLEENRLPSAEPAPPLSRASVGADASPAPPPAPDSSGVEPVNDLGPAARQERQVVAPSSVAAAASPAEEEPVGGDDAATAPAPPPAGRTLSLAGFRLDPGDTVADRRARLMRRLAEAEGDAQTAAKIDLARFFLAQAMAAETLAVLDSLGADELDRAGPLVPVHRGLSGAAGLLMGRLRAASENLSSDTLDGDPEVALWRAVLAAARNQWDQAARELGRSEDTLDSYPPPLQLRLGLPAAMISIETGRPEVAFDTLERIEDLDLHQADQARLQFIRGLAHARVGDTDAAIALWRRVEDMAGDETRVKAAFALATTELDDGRIAPEEAVRRLRAIRPLWRGHAWEPSMLDRLADTELAREDPIAAIHTWQELMVRHPTAARRLAVEDRIRTALAAAIEDDGPDRLRPLRIAALIEASPQLLPEGENGARLRRRLIDRLSDLGMVEPALALLPQEEEEPGTGPGHGARAASLHVEVPAPEAAIAALDRTEGATADPDLVAERARLRARALMLLDRPDRALAAVAGLDDAESLELRLRIHWRQRDWRGVAAAAERRLVDLPGEGGALSRSEQAVLVSRAIALTRLGDQAALSRLRERFTPAMEGADMQANFRLASSPVEEDSDEKAALTLASREIAAIRAFLAQ